MRKILSVCTFVGAVALGAHGAESGWTQLFNGTDLKGWTQKGGVARYEVKDGTIIGTTVTGTPNSFLCTEKQYGDFILELEFKVDAALNSGVQIRSEVFDQEKMIQAGGKEVKVPAGRVHGYQVEIDMDNARSRWWVGGIYDEGRRGWLFPGTLGGEGKAFTEVGAKTAKPGEWNTFRVEARGDTIKTFLNGAPRADIKDNMTLKGLIALQVHGIGKDKSKEKLQVAWRNVRIKEL